MSHTTITSAAGGRLFAAMTPRQRRQAERYQEVMGREATERALAEARRCTYCGGTLPAGHSKGCRFWGGREPLPAKR